MNFVRLASCFIVLSLSTNIQGQLLPVEQDGEDYYWREYTGTIPHDVLPGGIDSNGKPTYIGMTFFSSDILVPGEIDAATKTLFYAMNAQQQTATTNVKILCGHNPDHYEWISTNTTNLRYLPQKHLIPGGYWNGYLHLIGRIEKEGKLIVGKIYIRPDDMSFGWISNGKAYYIESDDYKFQVLSYNPKLRSRVTNNTFKSS